MKKLLLILNPLAGQKKAKRQLAEIVEIFQKAGYEVLLHLTLGQGDGTNAARMLGKEADLVVCSGGDGTLNEVVRGLIDAGADKPLGYLPAGSTNDFAFSIGLSTDLLQAARDVTGGLAVPIDAGRFDGRIFAYVAAFGAFTEVSYRTPQAAKNVLGRMAFLLEGVKELQEIHPIPLRVNVDGEQIEGSFIFGTVSNSTPMSNLIPATVEADLRDGFFEVTLARFPENGVQRAQLLTALRMGEHSPMVVRRRAKRLEIDGEEGVSWSLDGEHAEAPGHLVIENLQRAMRFVLPQEHKGQEKNG